MIKAERVLRELFRKEETDLYTVMKNSKLPRNFVQRFLRRLRNKGLIYGYRKIRYDPFSLLNEWIRIKKEAMGRMKIKRVEIDNDLLRLGGRFVVSGSIANDIIKGREINSLGIIYSREENLVLKESKNGRIIFFDKHAFSYSFRYRGYIIAQVPQICVDLIIEGYKEGYKIFERWIKSGRSLDKVLRF